MERFPLAGQVSPTPPRARVLSLAGTCQEEVEAALKEHNGRMAFAMRQLAGKFPKAVNPNYPPPLL